MADHVESMAYANAVPWHGLGNKVHNNLSPEAMCKASKTDWEVEKREMFFKKNGSYEKVDGSFALTRKSDESVLSVVGATYKPVQNLEGVEFFKKFVVAGKMKMETMGSLWNGRYIWALARLGHDFTLGKEDEIDNYLLWFQPHIHGKAMLFQYTAIRVVCWNTLQMAIGASLRGSNTSAFRMPHSTTFNEDVKQKAEEALGLAVKQSDEFHKAATLLSKKRIKEEDVEEYFFEVLQFDPKTAVKNKDGADRVPRMLPKFQEALNLAPGSQLPTALGTLWGALNAVTYVIDHDEGRDKSTALRNAWLGHKANIKRRALDLALDRAK
jgi:phage/plasmid-like protein (TIGR03299 family)